MNCEICSSQISEPIEELFALPTITSDCRPWSDGRSVTICFGCGVMKRITKKDFGHVYDNYISYPEPTGRTSKILDFFKDKMPIPKSVLDIGTGTGAGLHILKEKFPNAFVFGYEPTICIERPVAKFDLITLFQVLEHVENLTEMFTYIKSSLSDNGHVLIQIPYTEMWPFDLIIADHCWHFSKSSLRILLRDNGFDIKHIGNDVIKKEITVLAGMSQYLQWGRNEKTVNLAPAWLLSYKSSLDAIHQPVVIYGTGPAAAWVGNILGEKTLYYIDDDPDRQQKFFNGKRVGPTFQCDFPVIAPFAGYQLKEIKNKNPGLRFLC